MLRFLPLLLLSTFCMAQEVYRFPAGAKSRVSSFENLNSVPNAGGQSNRTAKGAAFDRLPAGTTKTLLDIKGAGMIQRMWFTVRERDSVMLRQMRLRMYWDGETQPAVDVPFGDFFVSNLGRTLPFQSELFSSPEGRSYNCYISMPFRKGARVTITNENKVNQSMLYFDIDYVLLPTIPADALYFHAYFTRQPQNKLKQDFEVLPELKGRGRFLGMSVGVNADKRYGNTWWGEGEVKIYLDGDSKYPTINGTGTEDYIGTGWGLGAYAHRYQGSLWANDSLKQYVFYRWHVPDAIYFNSSIRVTLQQIGGGEFEEVKAIVNKGIVPIEPITIDGPDGFTKLYERNPVPNINEPSFPKGWVNFYRVDDYSAVSYFYYDKASRK